jgi:hypothetical protein
MCTKSADRVCVDSHFPKHVYISWPWKCQIVFFELACNEEYPHNWSGLFSATCQLHPHRRVQFLPPARPQTRLRSKEPASQKVTATRPPVTPSVATELLKSGVLSWTLNLLNSVFLDLRAWWATLKKEAVLLTFIPHYAATYIRRQHSV